MSFTRYVLAERPKTHITDSTFRKETASLDDLKPGSGQVVVKVDYLSLDPAMRGWLNDSRSYIEPVKIGAVMRAGGIGTVIKAGEGSKFQEGDVVQGTFGFTEYTLVDDKVCTKLVITKNAQMLDFLGPLGMPGLTAYFGVLDVGKIKSGETLVVSGAAGAVGSIACQIGKLKGAKVIAIAGEDAKCRWLEEELGVDKALNYKGPDFKEQFRKEVGYLDVYFDNVGGEILDLALSRMNKFARIAFCDAAKPAGLQNYLALIGQRATLQGFIVFDYANRFKSAIEEMAGWLAEGKLRRKFHVLQGIDNAPKGIPMLFEGANTGKLVVQVSREPSKL